MTYLSSMERIGMEIGRKEGRRDAFTEMLSWMLNQRFGELDASVGTRLANADADQLAAWAKSFLNAGSLAEVFEEK